VVCRANHIRGNPVTNFCALAAGLGVDYNALYNCLQTSANDRWQMPLEIERKFLLANDGWKRCVVRRIRIRDGLIASNNGNKARVRISDATAMITLKSRKRGAIRTEFEYAIPCSDAEEILRTMCDGNVLDKVRHVVRYADLVWHVDVYEGILDGVVLAEIELRDADQKIELPDWIGREVTGDPGYRKVNMLAQRSIELREARIPAH
jgi:adenylate cyclase